ncbi:MAG: hypothetical protein GW939_04265 [Candidatus Magasanikbacteria bacterium]|nr:hypothetical protein [Candidatus Magasanikbacteria bacterium]NCS72037.1 hypothetical protein [Candidatus Magasanikbacteria bacterium]
MNSLFQKFGLDETEARVYSALLTLGSGTVTEVTSTADVTRTLGYSVLEKLQSYGLVKNVSRETSKKKIFIAESPEKIVNFVEKRKNDWNDKLEEAKKSLPNILSLYKMGSKPVLRYEENISIVENVSRETFSEGSEICSIINLNGCSDSLKSIVIKNISDNSLSRKVIIIDEDDQSLIEASHIKKISSEMVPSLKNLKGEVSFQGKTMLAITPKQMDVSATIIECDTVNMMLSALFDLAWNNL